jgi:hypothetical protein
MDKIALAFGGIALTICGIFFLVIFGTLVGGIAGYVVGLFFGDTILQIAGDIGIKGVTMFQFGSFLGFVSGFLKTKVSAEVKAVK